MNSLTSHDILTLARETLHKEADALTHMAAELDEQFVGAVDSILACTGKVILTGMGKSGLIGRKVAATLASTGTPSFYLHPGEAFHGDLGMISSEDVVVALSHSGETDEVLKIVPFIQSNGNVLISITSNPESTLAKNSNFHLNVCVKEEACILHLAPTTSTTAQLAMGDALAVALMKARDFTAMDFARLHPGGSLGRRLLMTVGQVMRNHDLPIVPEEATAAEMIHAISRGGLGLIVVQREETILGIITDGDIRRAMESRQGAFFDIRPMDIATREPKCISPGSKLIEAERAMTRHKVNSLLVTDDNNRLIGVIQIYDIKL
jgi:arabinose-5-phosphate isomerase